jgi:hypothetical protein
MPRYDVNDEPRVQRLEDATSDRHMEIVRDLVNVCNDMTKLNEELAWWAQRLRSEKMLAGKETVRLANFMAWLKQNVEQKTIRHEADL